MLSGIKFVPRAELRQGKSDSDSHGSDEERRKERKKEKKKKMTRKGKKRYSSDSESPSPSESDSDGSLSKDRRRRKKKEIIDEDSDSSDSSEYEDRKRRKKKKREIKDKRKRSKHDEYSDDEEEEGKEEQEEKGLIEKDRIELARKEMGLEFMLKSGSRSESNRNQNQNLKEKEEDNESEEPNVEQVRRPDPKELNPYLKDNGTGYPEETNEVPGGDQLLGSSVVGDGGASWRLKALKRAKEQAAREGRTLEQVVGERWGSLSNLVGSVTGSKAASSHAHLHAIRSRKSSQSENTSSDFSLKPENRDYLRGVSSRHPEMRKPRLESLTWKRNNRGGRENNKPNSEDTSILDEAISGLNKFSNDGSFLDKIKNNLQNSSEKEVQNLNVECSKEIRVNTEGMSKNQLAAKILQLRIKGKHEEADRLSKEMEDMAEQHDIDPDHTVTSHIIKPVLSERKRREEDSSDLQLAKKIMQNKKYSVSESIEDEYEFDDFAPGGGSSTRKSKKRNKETGNENSRGTLGRQMLTQKERCMFCFENPSRPKHLVVSIANFTYLMLPQWQPVAPGHCIILPLQHEASTRTVDQNVWGEIRNFKKCLIKMFSKQEKEMIFLETIIGLAKQRRHCLIECVPVPYHLSNSAPMYFKKAIDEAEEEWGQHEMKKLIPTKGNLHQVIPPNFAYFHVEFGLDRGFVHVIDDESNFSSGFGLNVLRGMLQLPEEEMHRKRRYESADRQREAVATFVKDWEHFDWTKQLDDQ